MKHVDALSRQPHEEAKDAEVVDARMFALRIDTEDWLLTMQLQDKRNKVGVGKGSRDAGGETSPSQL